MAAPHPRRGRGGGPQERTRYSYDDDGGGPPKYSRYSHHDGGGAMGAQYPHRGRGGGPPEHKRFASHDGGYAVAAPYQQRGRGGGPRDHSRYSHHDGAENPRLPWGQLLAGKLKAIDPRDARALHAVMEEARLQWDGKKVTTLLKELRNARANFELSFKVVDWCSACKGVTPDVFTYSALISACAKAGQSDRAFDVYEDMRRERVTPNVITYNALISACEKAEQSDLAFEVYDAMRSAQRRGRPSTPWRRRRPRRWCSWRVRPSWCAFSTTTTSPWHW